MPKIITKTASMLVKSNVEDKVTKDTIHEDEETIQVKVPMRELKENERYGSIRVIDSVKLSKRFQSVGIEVGFAEFPVVCTVGHPELNAADFQRVYDVVENAIVSKMADLNEMLAEIQK